MFYKKVIKKHNRRKGENKKGYVSFVHILNL